MFRVKTFFGVSTAYNGQAQVMDKSFATESQKRRKCCYNNGKRPAIKFDCFEKSVSPRACSTQNEK